MARKRRQNPEATMLQSEADDAIITSGAVMDEVYSEYGEISKDLSVLAKIEAKLQSQDKSLNREGRARRRALIDRLRQLDKLIAAYTSRVIKQSKSRLKDIKASPLAKFHKRDIATVERDIFKLEKMVKRKGSDVRLMSNSLIGGIVTLENSMGIKPSTGARELSRAEKERANIRKLFLATYVRWDQVKKHARKNDKFFIRGSEVFHEKYGSGIIIDNDGRKITVKFEGIPYKEMTKAKLVPGPVMWVDAQLDALKNKFKKGRSIAKSDIQRIVAKIVSIHNKTKPRKKLKTYKEAKRALERIIGKIETRLSGDKMDKATVEAFLIELEEFQNAVPARMKSEWAKVDQRQWATDVSKVRKALVKLKRKANPCIGFHFHGKDADELLKAVEASNARQRKGVKKNPSLPVVFHAKRGKEEIKVYEHTDTWRYSYDVYLNGKRTKETGVHLDGPVVKRRVNKLLDQAKEDGRAFKIVKNDLTSWWNPKSNPTAKRARKYGPGAEEKKAKRSKERGYRFKREQREAKVRRKGNPGTALTKAEVKKKVKEYGLSARWIADWGEWRVAIPGKGNEASAYYTDDNEDAVGAAKMMASQLKAAKKKVAKSNPNGNTVTATVFKVGKKPKKAKSVWSAIEIAATVGGTKREFVPVGADGYMVFAKKPPRHENERNDEATTTAGKKGHRPEIFGTAVLVPLSHRDEAFNASIGRLSRYGESPTERNPSKKKATKKKAARKTKPEWQKLIDRCRKLWDHYCERPSKKRLKPVLEHLEKMKASTSKKVKTERSSCLRIANKEARRLKLK